MDMINGLRSTASFSQALLRECDNRAYVAAGNAVNLSIDPRFSRRRWRERGLLRNLTLKSWKSYSSERPAVGWSDWLDVWWYHLKPCNSFGNSFVIRTPPGTGT